MKLITYLITVLIYILLIIPIGVIGRLLRFDPLKRKILKHDFNKKSYWIKKK